MLSSPGFLKTITSPLFGELSNILPSIGAIPKGKLYLEYPYEYFETNK